MTVRSTRIEIYKLAPERRDAWKQLAISCKQMTNRLWQIWLCHHANNDSANKLRKHFDDYKRWQETKEGGKPEWPCKVVEEPLTKSSDDRSFYRIISREFPCVNARTRGLLTQAWQSRIGKRKAASGNLPGWVSILFANESLPSFARPQPIPFDHQNAKLIREGKNYYVELRIERLEESGKSVVERCQLMLGKRKHLSVRAIVDKCLSGEYTWKGSNLLFDRGKWYAVIAYEMPEKVREELDASKVLIVRPGKRFPWMVRIAGGSFAFGGNGRHVEHARRAIDKERSQRKEHYRWSGHNQKSHGRGRAEAVWTKLSSRWRDFTKRYNNEVSRRVINLAIRKGCGRIIYIQPKDSRRDNRFLSTVGASHKSQMTWDYFQFGTMLSSKCEEEGIAYGVAKKSAKTPAGGVRGVRKANESKRRKRAG